MSEERNQNQFRQGDVFIERGAFEPNGGEWKKLERVNGRIILALGEATGHAHVVEESEEDSVDAFIDSLGFIKLDVRKPVSIRHDEHGSIALDPGEYVVARQREYDPTAAEHQRWVAD